MSLQHILKIVNFCSYVKRSIFSFKTAQLFSECCLAKNAFQKLWISVGKTQYEMAFFHKKCLILCQCIFVMFAERLENKKTCAFFNWRNSLRKRMFAIRNVLVASHQDNACSPFETEQEATASTEGMDLPIHQDSERS